MIDAVKELFQLVFLRIAVIFFNCIEYCKVVYYYYSNKPFRKVDTSLLKYYLFNSPFKISKNFLIGKGAEDIYAYGETPLTTFDLIIQRLNIQTTDLFVELGCGRGRCCFWLQAFKGCDVLGIEWVPEFVEIANEISEKNHLKNINFVCQDMLTTDFSNATIIFLYGTCLEDEIIDQLIKKFSQLKKECRIITVSYSLLDYSKGFFEIEDQFSARFTWGIGEVFIHRVKEKRH